MSARRIHRILIAVLLLAGFAVLFAEYFGFRRAPEETREVAAPPARYNVVEARRNVERGRIIAPADVAVRASESAPPPGALTRLTDATGRVATASISQSEPVTEANTALPEALRLANLVPHGMRAIALRVSEETAVANLIRPGDRVDVLMTPNPVKTAVEGRSFAQAEARTVLQNILVLAVGEATVASNESPDAVRNVTLAVTPQEAAKVALIRSVGTEYLSLRANGDDGEAKLSAVSTSDLNVAAQAPAQPVSAARPAGRVVEVISGASANRTRVAVGAGR
jgi:pilus assembly protein CpaB